MSKSLLKTIIRILKILTWVCIFAGAYFAYAGFRYDNDLANKNQTYIALIIIATGWGMNKLSKILTKNFATEEDEQ